MEAVCGDLLSEWCGALRRLQIRGTGNVRLDGGIICPACGRIHGRCGDAMYPFLRMAVQDGDPEWIEAAKMLFEWTEHTVSQPNGSVINDIDSPWDGITVFYSIQLADCLELHGNLLDRTTENRWMERLERAAKFLYTYDGLNDNNINYSVSNALTLYKCGRILGKPEYMEKAAYLAQLAIPCFTANGLLLGEGEPRFKKTERGCRPVDIGYNVEESLPALILYAKLSGNREIFRLAKDSLAAHLDFMLEDGGWDNSFGTRKFKWTYWGSRTSDGCALGYLLAAEGDRSFIQGAGRNLRLMKSCTWDGLLAGGPHCKAAGQAPCVHHTFTHAKVLAAILDMGLDKRLEHTGGRLPRMKKEGIRYYKETDTWVINAGEATATVTACDWEYMPGGHTGGGTLSMLHHARMGPLLCAGMGEYRLQEPNNMQIPCRVKHECLALRIEADMDGVCYSSIYENRAVIRAADGRVKICGMLKDMYHRAYMGMNLDYTLEYEFGKDGVIISAECSKGKIICPLISGRGEAILVGDRRIKVEKNSPFSGFYIEVQSDKEMALSYGTERIFNLVPGFEALRIDILPVDGKALVRLVYGKGTGHII